MSTKSMRFMLVIAIVALFSMPVLAGEGCDMDEKHGKCPVEHAKVTSKEDVTLTGQLACRHCNLHETDSCEKVFITEDARYQLCPEGDVKAAEAISEHGEATILVKGTVMNLEDGGKVLRISTAEKS